MEDIELLPETEEKECNFNDDRAFNKLKELQKLIKKELSLTNLCKYINKIYFYSY